jgi:tRNA threonylcarbamoyladenosine biosynthesis protein TsaB
VAGVTLAMDAASGVGTVAVLRDGTVVAECNVVMRSEDEERFLPAVLATLEEAGEGPRTLGRIVCGAGPGSFTSLRVVGACAKGLAFGGGVPLFAVPSLALIAAGSDATRAPGVSGRWLATLDAMRGDRYLALVTIGVDGMVGAFESLELTAATDVDARAHALRATRIGPGEALDAAPHARGVARCAALIDEAGPVAIATWEPVYGRLAEAQVKWEAAQGRPLGR